jgi:hypothetical protein
LKARAVLEEKALLRARAVRVARDRHDVRPPLEDRARAPDRDARALRRDPVRLRDPPQLAPARSGGGRPAIHALDARTSAANDFAALADEVEAHVRERRATRELLPT